MTKKKTKWHKGLRRVKYWRRIGKSNYYYRYYKIGSQSAAFHRRRYTIDKVNRLNAYLKLGYKRRRKPLKLDKREFGEWIFGLKKPKKDIWISIYKGYLDKQGKMKYDFVHKELLKKDYFFLQLRKIFNENYEEYQMGELFFTLNKYA